MHILLIQGEGDKRTALQTLLQEAGHQTTVSTVREEVERLAPDCDVVLLNHDELPEMGSDFVWSLRQQSVQTPIMVVTYMNTWSRQVSAFDSGASDYFANPISDRVLLGRVQLLVKRCAV